MTSWEVKLMEDLVRQLIAQGAETRNLDYKGPMAWKGSKAQRAELIRDLMCFSNTPDGGYILVGVQESPAGWNPVGVSEKQAETFDPTKIGDLAQGYCSVRPVFRVHRLMVDSNLYVLIVIDEFGDQPVVCTKDCHDDGNQLVLRAGAVYSRTVDAKCTETRTAEDMQRILDLAIRKRGDALLMQVAGLLAGRRLAELPPTSDERFERQRTSADSFFNDNGLVGPSWEVEIRPEGFTERVVDSRTGLAKARDDAVVALRGWDFPHVDREHVANLSDGIQSFTRWAVHHEAHRIFLSGSFVWRKLLQEDYEGPNYEKTLMYESTIWSYVETWLFASRFLSSVLESGNIVVEISIDGLEGRKLRPDRPSVSLWPGHSCQVQKHRQRHAMALGELRASYLEHAASDAIDLFELFGVEVAPAVVHSWQEKLLKREF